MGEGKVNYNFFKNGSKCDSTYVETKNDGKIKFLYCLKNGTKSFVKTNNVDDTLLIKKYLNKNLLEKIQYGNNRIVEKSLLFDLDNFEHLLLKFFYSGENKIMNNSFYFQFKENEDSTFFRLNPNNEEVNNADSIWVSDFTDYYPVYDQLFEISYKYKGIKSGEWVYLPKEKLLKNGNIITILLYSKTSEEEMIHGDFVNKTRFVYLDNTIYRWNVESSRLYPAGDEGSESL